MVSTWSKTEIGRLYFPPPLILSLYKQENSKSHTKRWVKINDLAKQHKSKIIAKLSAKSTDLIPSLSLMLTHLIFTTTLQRSWHYYYPQLPTEETKTQRHWSHTTHNWQGVNSNPDYPAPECTLLNTDVQELEPSIFGCWDENKSFNGRGFWEA